MTTSHQVRLCLSELRIEPIHRLLLQTLDEGALAQSLDTFMALDTSEWRALNREALRFQLSHGLRRFLLRSPQLRDLVPESVLARLERARQTTLRHNLDHAAHLLRLKNALDREGIDCLLMKGLWINAVLYGDQTARRSSDIDLLFKPEDMARATQVFRQLDLGHLDNSVRDIRELAPSSHEFTLHHKASGVNFDIHWAMTRPVLERPVDEASFWVRSVSYPIAGMNCRSFKLEDHLLLLSYHAAEHHRFKYVGLRPLLDLAQVLTWAPRTVDWQDLSRRSRQLGWDKGLELMLAPVEDVTGLSPPALLTRSWTAEPRVTPDIRRLALEAMILDMDHKAAIGNRVLKVLQRPGIGERLAHVTERLIPAPKLLLEYAQVTRAQIRHRPWQWPLLYLQRWLRLVRDLVPKLLELACGDPDRRAELKRSARLQAWLHGGD